MASDHPVFICCLRDLCHLVKDRISTEDLTPSTYTGVENLLKGMQGRSDAEVVAKGSAIQVNERDILLGNIRPYLKKVWHATSDGGASPDVLVLRIKEDINLDSTYLYRALAADSFFIFYSATARGGKMPRGDRNKVLDFKIPVPPLEEQKRIADILDRMDALVNDLSTGLPAELEARRKQYAYYRDRLLTFPELPIADAS